jgi:hypothetical protein
MAEGPAALHVEWAIGVYRGDSPFTLKAPEPNRAVLTKTSVTDVPAEFVADPFMLQVGRLWYMFFEVMREDKRNGEIGLATSNDGVQWQYEGIVLTEPYHLSYPYVFQWMGEYFMIPESYIAGAVRLYTAREFPSRWSFVTELLSGPYFVDSSLLRFDGKWWLFTDASANARHDTLRLFWAEDLTTGWVEHPLSPIIKSDPQIARPAGRLIMFNNRAFRFAQSCYPVYGSRVRAFEITRLTTTAYQEKEIEPTPILKASGSGWNRSGMHHIDAHFADGRWIACVDGFTWREDLHA